MNGMNIWPEPTSYVDSTPTPTAERIRATGQLDLRTKYRRMRNLAHQRQRIIGILEHRIDRLEAELKAVTR